MIGDIFGKKKKDTKEMTFDELMETMGQGEVIKKAKELSSFMAKEFTKMLELVEQKNDELGLPKRAYEACVKVMIEKVHEELQSK